MQGLDFNERAGYGSSTVWRRPLPAALMSVADPKLVDHHHALADEHVEAAQRLHELQAALSVARGADIAAGAAARAAGEDSPEPTEPALRGELEEVRREHAELTLALPASARAILADVADRFEQAREHAGEQAQQVIEGVLASLDAVADGLDEASELLAQESWLVNGLFKLAERGGGRLEPYRAGHGRETGEAARDLAALRGQVERLLERRTEREQRLRDGGLDAHMTGAPLPSLPGAPRNRLAPERGKTGGVRLTPPEVR